MTNQNNKQKTNDNDELKSRREAITKCLEWMNELRPGGKHSFDQIEFRVEQAKLEGDEQASYRPAMVGVYSTMDLPVVVPDEDGNLIPNTLFVVPNDCIIRVNHSRFESVYKEMRIMWKQMIQDYKSQKDKAWKHVEADEENNNPWDVYKKNQGRVFDPQEVELMILLTMILFAKNVEETYHKAYTTHNSSKNNTMTMIQTPWFQHAHQAAQYWKPFLDTWPSDFSSLIFHWTDDEIETCKGTSLYGLIHRLKQEKKELFDTIIEPHLLIAVDDVDNSSNFADQVDVIELGELLEKSFERAVVGVYSRMHGIVESSSSVLQLIPMLDLINGAREDDGDTAVAGTARVNVELLEYPTYTALVAKQPTRLNKKNKESGMILSKGQELFFHYGSHPNINYISKFGFLPLEQGEPKMHRLDMVFMAPPLSLMPKPSDKERWYVLSEGTNVPKDYYQNYLGCCDNNKMNKQSSYTLGDGTPFCYFGNEDDMKQFRTRPFYTTEEDPSNPPATPPMYMERHVNFIMAHLLDDVDIKARAQGNTSAPQETIIDCLDIGKGLEQIIDERLRSFGSITENGESSKKKKGGNHQTAYYYKCLEREILTQWKHAIACYYGLYEDGILSRPTILGDGKKSCIVCQSTFRLKRCKNCYQVYYCSRQCQIDDWKLGGHKEQCKIAAKSNKKP